MTVLMRICSSCGSEHMGLVPCGMTFMQRMRTVQVDYAAMETRDLKNYYDAAAVETSFPGATEKMYDDTDGIGYVNQADDGDWYYRNRKTREVEKADEKVLDTLLGANDEVTV